MMPMLLRLKGIDSKGKRFTLWLPLFLIYLILLPLLVIPLPFVLLAALIAWPFGYGCLVIQVYFAIFKLLGCLSGLKVDIGSGDGDFFIKLV
jgi:hypothetical protein